MRVWTRIRRSVMMKASENCVIIRTALSYNTEKDRRNSHGEDLRSPSMRVIYTHPLDVLRLNLATASPPESSLPDLQLATNGHPPRTQLPRLSFTLIVKFSSTCLPHPLRAVWMITGEKCVEV